MNDAFEYVVFPSQKSCWPSIQNLLKELKLLLNPEPCDLCKFALTHQQIVDIINTEDVDLPIRDETCLRDTILYGFVEYLEIDTSEAERALILQSTLPKIIDLALDIEKYVDSDEVLKISVQHQGMELRCILYHLFYLFYHPELCGKPIPILFHYNRH